LGNRKAGIGQRRESKNIFNGDPGNINFETNNDQYKPVFKSPKRSMNESPKL